MKRVGKIFEEIVEYDNLRLAFWKASRGKRSRDDQISFGRNLDDELTRLRDGLRNLNYFIGDFKRFTIYDPKEREICAATFGERVLHHAIMNVCESYFDKWLIYDSYACRKGKGQIAAVKRAREFASKYCWFMKCDFKKYFDSIPHDKLKFALARKFKDRKVLDWFYKIIDSYEKTDGRGLPIGSLTSQHFANFYLDPLDRYLSGGGLRGRSQASSVLASRCKYIRYMDDFVFWSNQKEDLIALRRHLVDFIHNELDLEFKQEPFINRTIHGMDFLGMRIFPNAVRLSRQSRVRYQRKMKAYDSFYLKGVWDDNEYQARITALTAFTDQAQSRAWRRKILAICEEHRAITVSCAGAAGTTTPGTAAPPTATGTGPATATTTTASASLAPQHRRKIRAVPADGQFPVDGTNDSWCSGVSSEGEDSRTFYYQGELWHR